MITEEENSIGTALMEKEDQWSNRLIMDRNVGPIIRFWGAEGGLEVVLGVENTNLVQEYIESPHAETGRFYVDKHYNFLWVMAWNVKNFTRCLCTADKRFGFHVPDNRLAEAIAGNPGALRILKERGITEFWQEQDTLTQNYIIRDLKTNTCRDVGNFADAYGEYSAVVAVRPVLV